MPTLTVSREPRIKKSISLRPDQYQAVLEIAREERHDNVSLIFQRLIDAEIQRREALDDSRANKASAA